MLILRAQNYASGALRSVSRDLRTMGKSGTVAGKQLERSIASQRMWARVGAQGAVMRDLGRSTRMYGLAAAFGIGIAAKSYADFNTQAGLVATQTGATNRAVGKTAEEMNRNAKIIESGILRQMRNFPAPAKEMSDALYEIYSSTNLGSQGLKGVRSGLRLLTMMNKAAVAGQVDLSDVTVAATTTMNAFGGGVAAMPKRLQRMFAAVRFGRMNFGQLLQAFNQIIPAAKASNQTFDVTLGTFAALTRLMPNTRMAATALSRMLELIGRKAFVTGMKAWGHEITDAKGRLLPLPDILQRFNKLIAEQPEKKRAGFIRNFFKEVSALGEGSKSGFEGTVQARRALMHLLKSYGLYRQVLKQTTGDNNEFTKSFAVLSQRAGVKWNTFMNRLRATFIQLGAAAIPVLMELLKPIENLAHWFNNLDAAQRKSIAKWAVYIAAAATLGGSIAALVGSLMVLVSLFGQAGSMGLLFKGAFVAAAVALALFGDKSHYLTAQIGTLGDAVKNLAKMVTTGFLNLATSGFVGFAASVVIAVGAVNKLRNAFIGMQVATGIGQAAGAAGGIGGMFAAGKAGFGRKTEMRRIGGLGGFNVAGKEIGVAARSGNALKAALGATAISAAGIVGSIGPLVGITLAVAGAAGLWALHQRSVRMEAERIAKLKAVGGGGAQAAGRVAALGTNLMNLKQTNLQLRQANLNIKQYREELKKAKGAEQVQAQINLDQAILDRGVALDSVHQAQLKAMRSATGVTDAIKGQTNAYVAIQQKEAQLATATKILNQAEAVRAGGARDATNVTGRYRDNVVRLQKDLAILRGEAAKTIPALTQGMGQTIRQLQRAQFLKFPMAQFGRVRDTVTQLALQLGRMPTLKEMKQVVRATLDPGSLAAMPAQIKRAIGIIKVQAQIDTRQRKVADLTKQQRAMFSAGRYKEAAAIGVKLSGEKDALANLRKARGRMLAAVKKAIVIHVRMQPANTVALGLAAANGVASGIRAGTPNAVAAAQTLVQQVNAAMVNVAQAKSPSRLTKRTVGIPMVEGIIQGILSKAGQAADAAVYTIDKIEGASVAKMTSFLQKQKKLIGGMNNNLQTLVNRKVPLQLVYQLAQMGSDGAKQIAKLAGASKSELAKFVAAWRGANSEVNRSARFNWQNLVQFVANGAQKLLDIYNQARDQLKSFVFDSLSGFTDMARRGADAIGNAFGQIFQGPQNISDHIGKAFDDAMASYSSSMAGLQQQMQDLQQRQADTISEFMQRRRDELRTAFGQLFSGPILSEGFAAGSIRDLQADLERQLAVFNDWRASLDKLAARGLPRQLLKDLETLGPDARDNLALLANASDTELGKYVDTWKGTQSRIEEVTQATFMDMDGFAAAMEDIAKQMADVMKQMSELQAPKRADFGMLLADLQAQKDAWTNYQSILTQLEAKGLPGLLLTQLAELGVEGVDILQILNNASAAQLAQYVALWTQSQDAIKAAKDGWVAAMTPDTIISDLQAQVDALTNWEASIQGIVDRGVPKKIVQQLREMGPDALPLLQGINSMTDEELQKFVTLWTGAQGQIDTDAKAWVDAQIVLWKQHGSNIAAGIIAGVMDEQAGLLKFFRQLFLQLLETAQKETKSKSPSQVYYELGQNIVQGFQAGLSSMTPSLAMPGVGNGFLNGGGYAAGGGTQINMDITAHQDESLQSTLERASFRMRQRRVA